MLIDRNRFRRVIAGSLVIICATHGTRGCLDPCQWDLFEGRSLRRFFHGRNESGLKMDCSILLLIEEEVEALHGVWAEKVDSSMSKNEQANSSRYDDTGTYEDRGPIHRGFNCIYWDGLYYRHETGKWCILSMRSL